MIVSIGIDVVAKIDDQVYVLSIMKITCYFPFVFYCAKESRVVENNESDVATLKVFRWVWFCEDIGFEILLRKQWIFTCL